MKYLALLLILTVSIVSHSQKIEKFYDFHWKEAAPQLARFYSVAQKTDSGWYREDYYIREKSLQMKGLFTDSNFKVKNGEFVYLYPDKKIENFGLYKNDLKQGLWLSYHENGMMSDSTIYLNGQEIGTSLSWDKNGYMIDSTVLDDDGKGVGVHWFENGNVSSKGRYSVGKKKNGIWIYYHSNGNKSSVENYENDSLLSRQYFDVDGNALKDTVNTEKEAEYPGGIKAWQKYLVSNLMPPRGYKIEGADRATIVINFSINEDGKVCDAYVSSPFHPAYDNIALNIINKSKPWIPAIDSHNRIVKARKRQPVTFAQPTH